MGTSVRTPPRPKRITGPGEGTCRIPNLPLTADFCHELKKPCAPASCQGSDRPSPDLSASMMRQQKPNRSAPLIKIIRLDEKKVIMK